MRTNRWGGYKNYYRLNFGETILDVIAAAAADKCGDI
jgi:hypothetical protein